MTRLGGFVALTVASLAAAAPPDFAAVRDAHRGSSAVLLDRHGEIIHESRRDPQARRLAWVALGEVSPALVDAVVQAEDRRFREHEGVDWKAMAGAAWDRMTSDSTRGGSTITMQVAARLDPGLAPAGGRRSLSQKFDQVQAARELEARWSKDEILEAYLNLVPFRGELVGVNAAARGLFGKAPGGLDRSEAAVLAALLRGPNAAPEAVARRACAVVRGLGDAAPSACALIERVARDSLDRVLPIEPAAALAPHAAARLLKDGANRVASSLDGDLQRFAVGTLRRQLDLLADRNVRDGAVLAVDNATGEVLAYVGSAGPRASAPHVDGVMAQRQAGSTLKPFLYGLAIERRLLTAASVLDDSPVNLVTPAGLYVPQNYDREFRGPVSLRTALGSSLNVPAVRTLALVGVDDFAARLRGLGFSDIAADGEHYGYSLALGSAEVRLWQLVNAYRTMANGGRMGPLSLVPVRAAAPGGGAMDAAAAWIVSDILADRDARSVAFGLDSALAARTWAAVKTGTSKDMRDNWCVGYSGRYTVGVWVGNADGRSMWDVSGVHGAAPVWAEVMGYLHRNGSDPAPAMPAGVRVARVSFQGDLEPPRQEAFLRGTSAGTVVVAAGAMQRPRIVYPAAGAILAVDPDIPPDRQRVALELRPSRPDARWRVNGDWLAGGGSTALWTAVPGSHRAAVFDAGGELLDEVGFEVRGARQRARAGHD